MKKYTIIAGVNGVGKSSMTGLLTRMSYDLGIIMILIRSRRSSAEISLWEEKKQYAE